MRAQKDTRTSQGIPIRMKLGNNEGMRLLPDIFLRQRILQTLLAIRIIRKAVRILSSVQLPEVGRRQRVLQNLPGT